VEACSDARRRDPGGSTRMVGRPAVIRPAVRTGSGCGARTGGGGWRVRGREMAAENRKRLERDSDSEGTRKRLGCAAAGSWDCPGRDCPGWGRACAVGAAGVAAGGADSHGGGAEEEEDVTRRTGEEVGRRGGEEVTKRSGRAEGGASTLAGRRRAGRKGRQSGASLMRR
jgi:hypothetical protein